MTGKRFSLSTATLIFSAFTAYFYTLLFLLLPFLKSHFTLNPALYWFIIGYFLFIPVFSCAILLTIAEGNRSTRCTLNALHVKSLKGKDLRSAIAGLLAVFIATGLIFGISLILENKFHTRPLSTTPWFMEIRPFQGPGKWLLLVWLPMFFFNIAGEELLWRGTIQSRLRGKGSWPFCSLMWWMFHLPFGFDLMVLLIPVILVVPYVFHKTKNTTTGIFIHGLYNGPVFVAVAMGWIR